MYVSKIMGLNNPNNVKVQKKSINNTNQINFRSVYAEDFQKVFQYEIKQLNPDVCEVFRDMMKKASAIPNTIVSPLVGAALNSKRCNKIQELLNALCVKESEDVLIKEVDGKDLLLALHAPTGEKYLRLCSPSDYVLGPTDNYFDLYIDNKDEYTLTRHVQPLLLTDIFTFYKFNESHTGRVKKFTQASGSFYSSTSTSTYYRLDGSVREGRSLLRNWFGI